MYILILGIKIDIFFNIGYKKIKEVFMRIVFNILIVLVAVEFLYIMYLETIVTTSKKTQSVFKMDEDEINRISVKRLFKNQGVYNGLISVGLLYSNFLSSNPIQMTRTFLVFIVGVAIYGSFSFDKSTILKQGGLAILGLIVSFFI